jgi:hypothetical protein
MNLSAAAVVLRPRTVSEVLDLACRVCVRLAARLYLRLSAFVLLPCFAGCLALRQLFGADWWVVWCVAILLATLAQGPFTVAIGRILFSQQVTVTDCLAAFSARAGAYLRSLFSMAMLLALLSWTVILVPWVSQRLLFVHEVCLLEGGSDSVVWKRCRQLVAGRESSTLLVVMLLWLARIGCVFVAEELGNALVDDVLQLGRPLGRLWSDGGTAFALAGLFASVPYVATARFLQYIDTRTRSDGWDIQLKFMAIGAREQARRKAA